MHKGWSGRPRTSTSETSSVGMFDSFTKPPQKSITQYAHETDMSRANVGHILQRAKWKVFIPQSLLTLKEDETERRT
ncbi:hypothetical protein TNCV_4827011 [Trichonephila clavipes]|nr:hypothetical protein TNCV_4827011 [Trichonephila clavipes]